MPIDMYASSTTTSHVSGALGYLPMIEIQRAQDGGSFEHLTYVPCSYNTFDDTTVVLGHDYLYRARRIIDGIPNDWSNVVHVFYGVNAPIQATSTCESSISANLSYYKFKELQALADSRTLVDSGLTCTYSAVTDITPVSDVQSILGVYTPLQATCDAQSDTQPVCTIRYGCTVSVVCQSDIQASLQVYSQMFVPVDATSSISAHLCSDISLAAEVHCTSITIVVVFISADTVESVSDVTGSINKCAKDYLTLSSNMCTSIMLQSYIVQQVDIRSNIPP